MVSRCVFLSARSARSAYFVDDADLRFGARQVDAWLARQQSIHASTYQLAIVAMDQRLHVPPPRIESERTGRSLPLRGGSLRERTSAGCPLVAREANAMQHTDQQRHQHLIDRDPTPRSGAAAATARTEHAHDQLIPRPPRRQNGASARPIPGDRWRPPGQSSQLIRNELSRSSGRTRVCNPRSRERPQTATGSST